MGVVEIFLRRMKLEPLRDKDWLTVYIDLTMGFDLSSIDLATVRLNDSLPVAAAERCGDALGLKFPRRGARALVGPARSLTITGRFDDGIWIRGTVQIE
jgi:hypothetical protein